MNTFPCVSVCVCVSVVFTFLPPGEQESGGGVLVLFRGLEPQLEGDEPRILGEKGKFCQPQRERHRGVQRDCGQTGWSFSAIRTPSRPRLTTSTPQAHRPEQLGRTEHPPTF